MGDGKRLIALAEVEHSSRANQIDQRDLLADQFAVLIAHDCDRAAKLKKFLQIAQLTFTRERLNGPQESAPPRDFYMHRR